MDGTDVFLRVLGQELLTKVGQHFILISRGPMPAYLSLYEATGSLLQLGSDDLALDIECLTQLAMARQLSLSSEEIQRLRDETGGCPAADSGGGRCGSPA